jgi:hypothetical protein
LLLGEVAQNVKDSMFDDPGVLIMIQCKGLVYMSCPNYTSVIDVMPHGGVIIRYLARFRTPTMEDSTSNPGQSRMVNIYGSD